MAIDATAPYALLLVLLLLATGNLSVGLLLWWRQNGIAVRVAKLEAFREAGLTHAEIREIYERLSSIEGQIGTTNRLMQTMQEHLLENDR
ncbi:hypothetical protein [Vulcaniibacterium tengchongense]|uniref:Phage shock protein B n=1 Tax=Vulcaniibacterium tengchongense TaxID=1273429 RepID=A0A3N4VJF6_9GAMM|nr:hypothetical protein [Vulcaniibacterium tengchongense]RPE81833.1 hypothetical protein EDC50_1035 [Vulcaniibacterium tengchongense]